jgi:hypothetical protein
LTGPNYGSWPRVEPVIKLGHRPTEDTVWSGQPAVTVDLNAGSAGVRTFEDGRDLVRLAIDILRGAAYLGVEGVDVARWATDLEAVLERETNEDQC